MSDIVAIIPARSGSRGVADKNIKLLRGHPLIAYSIRAAILTPTIDRVIVSTDSKEYAAIARKYGGEAPFLRPKDISGDNSTDLEFVDHALVWLDQNEGIIPKLIVHLRPTTPLRDPRIVEKAISTICNDIPATALRSIHEMSNPAYKCFELVDNYLACICNQSTDIEPTTLPRQSFPTTYEPNGYVDILKTDFLMSRKKIHGHRVIGFQTPRVADIDTPDDFDYLAHQISRNPEFLHNFFS